MTSLNLLSQQKADSDQEAEVSVQRTFIVSVSRDQFPVFCLIFIVSEQGWVGTKYVIRNRRKAIVCVFFGPVIVCLLWLLLNRVTN